MHAKGLLCRATAALPGPRPAESIYSKSSGLSSAGLFFRRKETVREKEEALLQSVLLNSELH
jgi:hypothetical protein